MLLGRDVIEAAADVIGQVEVGWRLSSDHT